MGNYLASLRFAFGSFPTVGQWNTWGDDLAIYFDILQLSTKGTYFKLCLREGKKFNSIHCKELENTSSQCLCLVYVYVIMLVSILRRPRWCSGKESACQCKRL